MLDYWLVLHREAKPDRLVCADVPEEAMLDVVSDLLLVEANEQMNKEVNEE